jgi:hypothetical protein
MVYSVVSLSLSLTLSSYLWCLPTFFFPLLTAPFLLPLALKGVITKDVSENPPFGLLKVLDLDIPSISHTHPSRQQSTRGDDQHDALTLAVALINRVSGGRAPFIQQLRLETCVDVRCFTFQA